ncbi:hypothetical protein ACFPOD_01705 [Nitratireductor kimnyeongensis]|uniref:Uncharacterized protein n=1 Tax=Nitratireductor kimnyeongensis TaxID=430679 RepID=A0ABW0T3C8_9HYPH|nr:hypothetical protein [Nitratireductor kimnyeongensis]QZZ35152.1 hypothetical protein KW403_15485 [Nitratireductor kimnyeongensis]
MMGKTKSSGDFKRDAVAQITERGYAVHGRTSKGPAPLKGLFRLHGGYSNPLQRASAVMKKA